MLGQLLVPAHRVRLVDQPSKLGRESVKLVPRKDRRHFINDYNNIESALKRDKVMQ
jgi:hypothetical protein